MWGFIKNAFKFLYKHRREVRTLIKDGRIICDLTGKVSENAYKVVTSEGVKDVGAEKFKELLDAELIDTSSNEKGEEIHTLKEQGKKGAKAPKND